MELINGINRVLSCLNINPKYLNRAYIIVGAFPTFYMLELVRRFYSKGNHLWVLYLFVFFGLLYLLIINTLYWFFNRNTRLDFTQWFAKVLPDEVFVEEVESSTNLRALKDVEFVELEIDNMGSLIPLVKELERTNRLFPPYRNTLLPYYKVNKARMKSTVKLSSDNKNYIEIGKTNKNLRYRNVFGVFISGGKVSVDGVVLDYPYRLFIAIDKK